MSQSCSINFESTLQIEIGADLDKYVRIGSNATNCERRIFDVMWLYTAVLLLISANEAKCEFKKYNFDTKTLVIRSLIFVLHYLNCFHRYFLRHHLFVFA